MKNALITGFDVSKDGIIRIDLQYGTGNQSARIVPGNIKAVFAALKINYASELMNKPVRVEATHASVFRISHFLEDSVVDL